MKFKYVLIPLFISLASRLPAQKNSSQEGGVSGVVVDQASRPVEYATVTLKKAETGETAATAVTDIKGAFAIDHVVPGNYKLTYNLIGTDAQETPPFTLDDGHASRDLGQLSVGEPAVKMDKVQVSTRAQAFYNSIDRKVYNVGKDIQGTSGAASDLLQNIPSVDVDIDGNVSLRGSDSVLILVNGKPSTLMGANRAAVLEQLPADTIEKIEVITNPSAKYKPDGTAGIINIVLKHKTGDSSSGSVRANVGNDRRFNAGVNGSFTIGKTSVFGSFSIRQDDRVRSVVDHRSVLDPRTNTWTNTQQDTREHARPLSNIAQTGADYVINDTNKVGATVDYNHRTQLRRATEQTVSRDQAGNLTGDYDRLRFDPEYEKDLEFGGTYQHVFGEEGHELNFELKHDKSSEQEDNAYTNAYRFPLNTTSTFDHTLIRQIETGTEARAEYAYPMANDAKLEAGYTAEANRYDSYHLGSSFDPVVGEWEIDPQVTNNFVYDQTIHALYATYGRPLGQFGFLAGLRTEETYVKANQITSSIVDRSDYFRLYPSLHLKYNLTDSQQLQLNYSHRVRRPESDDLNPYPEYQDPLSLRAGNPHLKPEETHSIEGGYQYRRNEASYLATLYYRYTYNGFTDVVTDFITPGGDLAQLTTKENLAVSKAEGLELAASDSIGSKLSFNVSTNLYRSEIDASDLGYAGTRSAIAFAAKLNANYHLSKATTLQFNSNYSARRLTPQGERLPSFVSNFGIRHELGDKRTSLVFTVSDLFNSLKESTSINTPIRHEEIARRRSSRIGYVGVIYNFGKKAKKSKDDSLQFDNAP